MADKRQNKKPTTFEIVGLIVEIVAALAAIVQAIRWW